MAELDRVIRKDPKGKLGLQALYRSAFLETTYLGRHAEAIRKLRLFLEQAGEAHPSSWEAAQLIGDILFTRLEQYDQAVIQYKNLLRDRPDAVDAPMFRYRVGRSHFFLWQFPEAVAAYRELERKHPKSPWAEAAAFEIGVTLFTRGERGGAAEDYQEAIDAYERFIARYPKSDRVPEARFGIAFCMEEMDQLDAAYHHYEALKDQYPSPKVIELKLSRIRERKAQKSH